MEKDVKKWSRGEATRQRILDDIISYIEKHGYPPTVRELCESTGLSSTSTIHRHLSKMLEDGMIETDVGINCPRAIRVPGYKFVFVKE